MSSFAPTPVAIIDWMGHSGQGIIGNSFLQEGQSRNIALRGHEIQERAKGLPGVTAYRISSASLDFQPQSAEKPRIVYSPKASSRIGLYNVEKRK